MSTAPPLAPKSFRHFHENCTLGEIRPFAELLFPLLFEVFEIARKERIFGSQTRILNGGHQVNVLEKVSLSGEGLLRDYGWL